MRPKRLVDGWEGLGGRVHHGLRVQEGMQVWKGPATHATLQNTVPMTWPATPPAGLGTALDEGPTTELGVLPHHPSFDKQPTPRFALHDDEEEQHSRALPPLAASQPSLNSAAAQQGVVVEVLPSPNMLPPTLPPPPR